MKTYFTVAKEIAKKLGVPVEKLTLKAIQNAPIPVRFKKLLQGQTTGEASMVPTAMSSRQTAVQELKSFLKGSGTMVGPALAKAIFDSRKQGNFDPMNLAGPKRKTKTKAKSGNSSRGNNMKVPTQTRVPTSVPGLKKSLKPKPRPDVLDGKVTRSLRPKLRPKNKSAGGGGK